MSPLSLWAYAQTEDKSNAQIQKVLAERGFCVHLADVQRAAQEVSLSLPDKKRLDELPRIPPRNA